MDKSLSSTLSRLHRTVLKPLGFRKKSATFSREHADYTELFNIQASQWNGPWGRSFYVNCGLTFRDLPMESPWTYFPNTQWADRIETVVPTAPKQWDYSENQNMTQLTERLGACILEASEEFAASLSKYRQEYLERVERILHYRQGPET